ncbi:MAG TPA: sigma-70 family RNA polymerase sigma factor [Planctomycetaceae bacterium]|nr:sigma-70 family RNA polymerase sigma factor [Planctomycetaceae bacterium]
MTAHTPDESTPSLEALIKRLRSGDEHAADLIISRYRHDVCLVINAVLKARDVRRVVSTSDVCQLTFWDFLRSATNGRFDSLNDRQLRDVLIAIARYKTAEQVRKQRAACRDSRRTVSAPVDSLDLPDRRRNPAQSRLTDEVHDRLEEALPRLPPEDRDLLLARQSGRSWKVLATERGTTPDALRMKYARALQRLSQELSTPRRHFAR